LARHAMNAFPEDADEVLDLLKQHVPELVSGVVVVRGMARERGKRTVIAVSSNDPNTSAIRTFTRDQRAKRAAEGLRRADVETVVWDDPTEQVVRLGPTSELRIRRQISRPPEGSILALLSGTTPSNGS